MARVAWTWIFYKRQTFLYDPIMIRWLNIVLVILWLFAAACSGDKAKELLETAELEERQMNQPHAKQLYEDIIRLYPSSKEADTARARLAKLNPG